MIEEPPKEALIKGKIWHEVYEGVNNSEELIVSSILTQDYQEIFDKYRKAYSKILRDIILKNKTSLNSFNISMTEIFSEYWPHFEEEAKGHALNVVNFIIKKNVYGTDLWLMLTPKIYSEQRLKSETLNLSGIVDVIEVHDINGEKFYVPVELKTGKYPDKGMWDGHKIQLAAYMLLLKDSGKRVDEAVICYKGADRRLLHMNPFLKDEVLDLVRKTSILLSSKDIPEYVDNRNKCKTCQLKETCYDEQKLKTLLIDAESRLKNR
jgi:CRISPR-associated protein Cas4